ncbi:MAG: hypothetical protein K5860_06455 [Bacteroidales bacterium]|nr:hypothetical protein [Bacteroidales bacterium]
MKYNKLGEPIFRRLTEKSTLVQIAETAHELKIAFKVERKLVTCWPPELIAGKYPAVKHFTAEDFFMYLNDYMEERDLIKPLEPEI